MHLSRLFLRMPSSCFSCTRVNKWTRVCLATYHPRGPLGTGLLKSLLPHVQTVEE